MQTIARFFQIEERGSTIGREVRGGVATFLTMSYILVLNPAILAGAGIPFPAAVASTAAAAGISCLLMGLVANFPLALASGMGLNAVVAFQLAKVTGSWQTAMGLIVLDGIVILCLVLCGLREAMLTAIPRDLRRAIGAGIGLFIAFIGAVNAKIVVVPPATVAALAKSPSAVMPPVTHGPIADRETSVAVAGLGITAFFVAKQVPGAILLGILITTGLALVTGVSHIPTTLGHPSFETAFKADILGALKPEYVPLLLAVLLVDFFDTLGTVTAISEGAGLQDKEGRIPELKRILLVDSIAASIGGLFCASSVTSYIESAAGVAEGARTGLHTVVVGFLFLISIFTAPIMGMIPPAATAPALILVGFLMCEPLTRIEFGKLGTAIPSFVTLIALPFTYSITHGIGYGFLTFVTIKTLSLEHREVHPLMYGAALLFLLYFTLGS